MRSIELQVESMGSARLDELLAHIKMIEDTTKQILPIGKDMISTLPTEIICQIASNLEFHHLKAFRDANPREFGAPINKLLRDEHLLDFNVFLISAMFEAAAKRDVKMIRWLFENESAIGQTLIFDKPLSLYPDEAQFRIHHGGETHWYFRLTGEKLDDETMDFILTAGPNLMMAVRTEGGAYPQSPLGDLYAYDQYDSILRAGAHSALSLALYGTDEDRVERFIRLGTSPKLATSKTVSEFVQDSLGETGSIDWNLGARWAVTRGEADDLFLHTPLEEIDPDCLWSGGNLLHMAIFCSNPSKMIKFALSKGLSIEADNLAGEWPLQLAFDNDQVPAKVIGLLIDNGADTSVTPTYLIEPGIISRTKARREKVAVFLDWADIDWVAGDLDGNIFGESLLHVAVIWLMPIKYLKGLLKRGMDVNTRDCRGNTPVDRAWNMLKTDTVDLKYHAVEGEMRSCASRRGILIEIIEFLMKRGGVESNRDSMLEELEAYEGLIEEPESCE